MDSITQLALGAAVGEATLGSRVGNRAPAWGAVCGVLPDLDVFVPLGDAVRDFTYHRSASHSLLVMAVVTPLVVWLILKIHRDAREHRRRWFALVYLAFATHALLDSHTVYGTQILWPLDNTPVAWSTIFIIDPAYTLPLLVGLGGAVALRCWANRGHMVNAVGLILSSAYLMWSWGAKLYVQEIAERNLRLQDIRYTRLLTNPGPANTLLWRLLAMDESGYYEGFFSLLDTDREVVFTRYPSHPELLTELGDHWPVQRLKWFTKGFFSARLQVDDIVMTDLRMGFEPDYVFRFKVGEWSNPRAIPTPSRQLPGLRDPARLRPFWDRIWREIEP